MAITIPGLARVTLRVPPKRHPATPPIAREPAYVLLGRYGDISNLLPVLRMEAVKSQQPINVVVSTECAPIFDGVTYVNPVKVDLECGSLHQAEQWARERFGVVRTFQVWGNDEPRSHATAHYNEDAWLMAGRLREFKDSSIRPVFNARSPLREQKLIQQVRRTDKPLLLMAVRGGHSSPFLQYQIVLDELTRTWSDRFEIVDLDLIRTQRVYDLIGLMDVASCLVSADSVHLHLAAASNVPVVALLSDRSRWAESNPRCGTIWRGNYRMAIGAGPQIRDAIEQCLKFNPVSAPKLIHTTDGYGYSRMDEVRHKAAFVSWMALDWLEFKPEFRFTRSSSDIGGSRDLPYLKDLLKATLETARDQDVIVWTNSDTIVTGNLNASLWGALESAPIVTSRRLDYQTGKPHPGRDLSAFRVSWLRDHWQEIPDLLCGSAEIDNWMALEARRQIGVNSSARELFQDIYPADLPPGFLRHMNHGVPRWDRPEDRYTIPENLYNMRLLADWVRRNMPSVQLNCHGFIDWSK